MAEIFSPFTTDPDSECRRNQKTTPRQVTSTTRGHGQRLRPETVDCRFTVKGPLAHRVVRANS